MAAEASRFVPSPDSYIGSLLRVISNYGIRYEGIIDNLDPVQCKIRLRNVRSFGTEGRKKDGPQIPPSEKVYQYIVFRAIDIKDLRVISLQPVQTEPIINDPAIIQAYYSPVGPASSSGSGTISDQSSQVAQLRHARSTVEGVLPVYQAVKNIESMGSTPSVANCSGFGMPRECQGFYAPTSDISHLSQAPLLSEPIGLSIPPLPQHSQISAINSSFPSGNLGLHEAASPLPPIVSNASTLASTSVQHPNTNSLFATPKISQFSFPLPPPACCTPSLLSISLPSTVAPTHAGLLAAEPSLNLLPNRSLTNSHPASVFDLNIPLVSPLGYINTPGASIPENKNNTSIRDSPSNECAPSLPFQTISQYLPSSISSFSSIQDKTSLPLVTPGQLQHPRYSMLPSSLPFPSSLPVQTIHEYAKFKAQEPKIKSQSESLTYELTQPAKSMKEPLLPSPKYPSYAMLPSSLQVQTINENVKLRAQEPKIKSESETLMYELPPPATSMMEPLLPLPQHRSSMFPSSLPAQTIHEDSKFKTQGPKLKIKSEPLTYKLPQPATSMKMPLLPLPQLSHIRFSRPVTRFSEDFDFMAMNEKFNKAEVWGHLGKGKTLAEYDEREGQSSNVNAIRVEGEESQNLETQPAYSKDDFFDDISYRFIEPGQHSGTASVSEPLKVDTETSGDTPRHGSNRGGESGFRGGNGGRWRQSNHDRGSGSKTRGQGRGFSN